MRPSRMVLRALLANLLAAAPARAIIRLPAAPSPVPHNPADRLLAAPIEDPEYDPATRCTKTPRPGMAALQRWLEASVRGESWGTYRCEKWGEKQASLHAQGRAIDWHLDASRPAHRREAERLARLLLAPDSLGNPQALARRMGIEEMIWDCGYRRAGMTAFEPHAACFDKHGTRRKRVDPTVAHRNHIHIGLTKAGAMRRTSFWSVWR